MSVDRFEVGKTYRNKGSEFACEWASASIRPGGYQDTAGTRSASPWIGSLQLNCWSLVEPDEMLWLVVSHSLRYTLKELPVVQQYERVFEVNLTKGTVTQVWPRDGE